MFEIFIFIVFLLVSIMFKLGGILRFFWVVLRMIFSFYLLNLIFLEVIEYMVLRVMRVLGECFLIREVMWLVGERILVEVLIWVMVRSLGLEVRVEIMVLLLIKWLDDDL